MVILNNSERKYFVIFAISLLVFMHKTTRAITLEQLLKQENITYDQNVIKNLDKEISSSEILNDTNYFCAAYYPSDDPNLRNQKFCVTLLNKKQGKWIQRDIEFKEILSNKPVRPNAIMRINYSKNYFYIYTHINPSAGYLIILDKDLSFAGGVFGWLEAVFIEDSIIYHNNQIHFAPTHYSELSLYNISTKVDQKIYPMKPYQQVRLEHIDKVKAAYEEKGFEWFAVNNHHMNPELFNNSISGDVITNSQTQSFAFTVKYDNTDYISEKELLKLDGFGELRKRSLLKKIENPLPDSLFMSLYADLMKAKRNEIQDSIIDLFQEDAELKAMISTVLKSEDTRFGMNWKQYMISLDANWDKLENWKRFAQIIQIQKEIHTEVLYIYRIANNTGTPEYKEILLKDAQSKYGDIPLSKYLEPDLLENIFDN